MTMNCRSAKNKIADIAAVIDQHKPDIIFGTESWLNSNIESNEIFSNGYELFRKDRPDDCHGAVRTWTPTVKLFGPTVS